MIKLVIFDVDGVILNTEELYVNSALQNCKDHDYPIPREKLIETIGSGMENHKRVIMEYMGPDFDFDTYIDRQEEYWDKFRDMTPPEAKKGFFELYSYLKRKGIMTALATSTDRSRQLRSLLDAKVGHDFDFMVFGDDISRHKPDPQIYELVLEHFGYPKDEAIIIEDSINGIMSGLNAGVKVIYIPDLVKVPQELIDKTYRKLDDLSQCIDVIEELSKV